MKAIYFAAASLAVATGASAQQAQLAPVAPQQAMIIGAPVTSMLRSGTEVPMRTRSELSTQGKTLRVGQRIDLEVAQDVLLGGQVVIPAGTPATAELTTVRNKGAWGKSGYIEGRVLSLRVGDRQIRCSGVFNDKGVTGTAGVVAAIAFVPIAGFLTTGTSAAIPMGSAVKAFLDEDVPVQFAAAAAPPPLVVGSPAAKIVATSSVGQAATMQPAVATKN